MEIHSPADIEFLNVLVYGEPGAGKTYLAGTAQDSLLTSPILILDVEGGTTTLRKKPDVDVVQVRGLEQLVSIHKSILEKNDGYYKTVVIDSLTELQKLDMREIMRDVVNRRPDLDPDVPSQREWGKSAEHMRRIVRGFRDLKCNTIMTALMQVEKDENNTVTYYPSLPGKLRAEIPGFLDIVGYLYTTIEDEQTVRKLQVTKTRRVVAKDRTGTLGEVIVNPTIPAMWQQMMDAA